MRPKSRIFLKSAQVSHKVTHTLCCCSPKTRALAQVRPKRTILLSSHKFHTKLHSSAPRRCCSGTSRRPSLPKNKLNHPKMACASGALPWPRPTVVPKPSSGTQVHTSLTTFFQLHTSWTISGHNTPRCCFGTSRRPKPLKNTIIHHKLASSAALFPRVEGGRGEVNLPPSRGSNTLRPRVGGLMRNCTFWINN